MGLPQTDRSYLNKIVITLASTLPSFSMGRPQLDALAGQLEQRNGATMIAECPPEDALTWEDIGTIVTMSGPITLARHELNAAFYRSARIIRSGMIIEQHRGYFFAHRAGGPVLALEGDIGELLATLRDLDLL